MSPKRDLLIEKVELLVAELTELRSRGPHFRIYHRFGRQGATCVPGEEIASVCLLHHGREYWLPLSLSLRILFDYLARHRRLPQSAAQIAAGIRADHFYKEHASAAVRNGGLTRRIPRSYIRVYVERLRQALQRAFNKVGLPMDSRRALVSEHTVMNEIAYRLSASVEWTHKEL